MNILVLGWYYSSNLGDAVLTECTAFGIKHHFPRANVVIRDLIGRKAFAAPRESSMQAQLRLRRWDRLRVLATRLGWDRQLHHELWCLDQNAGKLDQTAEGSWDAVVFAGGQLFMDDLALYVAELVRRFEQKKIPVFFNACGTGPSCSPEIRRRLGQALNSPVVRYVSCRDDVSLVNAWCGAERAVFAADPALWTDQVFSASLRSRGETVGLGVMFPYSLNPHKAIRFWVRLIRRMQQRQIPWQLFTNGSPNDVAFALAILEHFPDSAHALCPAPRTPEALVEQLSAFSCLISFRLHSHIIASSLGLPSVALQWDSKVRFFMRSLEHEERCLTLDASAEQVLDTLQKARQEGVPREKLEQLRFAAARSLTDALDQVLGCGGEIS